MDTLTIILGSLWTVAFILIAITAYLCLRVNAISKQCCSISDDLPAIKIQIANQQQSTQHLSSQQNQAQQQLLSTLTQHQQQSLTQQQEQLHSCMRDIREQLAQTLQQQTLSVNENIRALQKQVDSHLHRITQQVQQRLEDGFAKTNTVFNDVIKRLALIDQAQQKITDLSSNVVGLQDILANKQARGHFGEIQLQQLIQNCLPHKHFALQHTFTNGKRVDCALFLPEPTGTLAIDAKFPLENYRALLNCPMAEQTAAQQRFRQDVKQHINAIADKYIISTETANAAILFLPAESVFAEIHAHHSNLIDYAYHKKVWLVSPTTMMAVLHTIQALLKDIETQKQVHLIQKHLRLLAEDFTRFGQRMDYVAKHIADANEKVGQVKISAAKISKRFSQIEAVDLSSIHALSGNKESIDA